MTSCNKCGAKNNDGFAYCSECGAALEKSSSENALGGQNSVTGSISSPKDTYDIEREYAVGGMGVTILVKSRKTGVRLILKQLRMDKVGDWKTIELFEREAEVLRQLDHPLIPKYIDYFQSQDKKNFNLVQSFIEGTTLQKHIEQQTPFSPKEFTNYFKQTLEILVYLHGMVPPVIHRDITPKNIIINKGKAFLVDFGSVKSAMKSDTGTLATTVGTFGYMPPEQMMGRAEAGSDMYSLGMSFIAFATHTDPTELPLNKKTGQVEVKDLLKQLSSSARETLESMTRMGLQDRLCDAKEALDILSGRRSEAVNKEEVRPKRISPTAIPFTSTNGFKLMLGAAGIVLIFLIGWIIESANESPPPVIVVKKDAPTILSKKTESPVVKPAAEPKTIALAQELTPKAIEAILISSGWKSQLSGISAQLKFARQASGVTAAMRLDDGDKLNLNVTMKKVEFGMVTIVMTGQRVNDGVTIRSSIYANITKDSTMLIGHHDMIYKENTNEYSTSERWVAREEGK